MNTAILQTKLFIPPLRPSFVQRTRLLDALNQGLTQKRKVTLISAPAGSGKTTLLVHWLGEQSRSVAWLSLDHSDNDPNHFLTYLITALQQIEPTAGESMLQSLGPEMVDSEAPSGLAEAVLTQLINELAQISPAFILVLDDYHAIEEPAIHEALARLLDHLPPQAHFVISTRSDPPVPLARLRARGQMTEIRTADLRFTPAESARFLNETMGLDLSLEEMASLEARTEGWVAGLQLAATSLQAQADNPQFIQSFAGTDRFILDYLLDEVLSTQSEERYSFLLTTSILQRLNGPLCDTLTGQSDGQGMLEQLEQENLFVLPLDNKRYWYRYHPLFADLLRHKLTQTHPDKVAELHRRASHWYQQQDLVEEAIEHALASGEQGRAATLIEEAVMPMLQQGRQFTAERWIETLPKGIRAQRPQLSLIHAWVRLFTGKVEQYAPPLKIAEEIWEAEGRQDKLGQVVAFRANLARLQRDPRLAIELAQRALAWLPYEEHLQRGISAMVLGDAYVQVGDVARARAPLHEALNSEQEHSNLLLVLIAQNRLADAAILEGHLHQAAKTYRQVLARVGDRPLWQRVEAHIGLGKLYREWNQVAEAEDHISQGLRLGERTQREVYLAEGYVALAWLHQSRGKSPQAVTAMNHALRLARQFEHQNTIDRINAQQARLRLQQGDRVSAMHWLERQAPDLSQHSGDYLQETAFLTAARIWLEAGKHTAAQRIIAALKPHAEKAGRQGTLIELGMLEALAQQQSGQQSAAVGAMQAALSMAEPAGYVRLFVDEGAPMAQLLQRLAEQKIMSHYVSALLEACRAAPASIPGERQPLIEPLSEREMEVLTLIAQGATNQEIADELIIALTTAKKHVSNILGKLGVHNRTEAARRGRELDLI